MAENETIFVTEDNTAVISCPECQKLKRVPVEKFKSAKHTLTVRCSCAHEFTINLNFRKGIRKQVHLKGTYQKISPAQSVFENCTVVDLSFKGARIMFFDAPELDIGDVLKLQFSLDDKNHTEINRKLKISDVGQDNSAGGEFIDTQNDYYDKPLGFYLMN